MILTECLTFAVMFAAGTLAGVIASGLLLFGKGSAVARAIFDFLAPLAVGAIFFFALLFSAKGEFRLYSALAFAVGMVASRLLLRRFSPALRRLARKVILPIKSLAYALEDKVSEKFAPIIMRLRAAKERRKVLRSVRREERQKAREARSKEKERRKGPARVAEEEGALPSISDQRARKGVLPLEERRRKRGLSMSK